MRSARLATPHMPPESRLVYSAKRCVYHSKNSLCGYVVNFGGSILCIHFTITAKVIYNNCSNLEIFGYKREREKKKTCETSVQVLFHRILESSNCFSVCCTTVRSREGEHRSIISSKYLLLGSITFRLVSSVYSFLSLSLPWEIWMTLIKISYKILYPILIANDHR